MKDYPAVKQATDQENDSGFPGWVPVVFTLIPNPISRTVMSKYAYGYSVWLFT